MKKITFIFVLIGLMYSGNIYAQINNKLSWEAMKYGLFVHFVYGGEYGGMTPLNKSGAFPANIDEFAEKFNVQKFANDVQTMGFEYVIFTAWHANMGVLYPSKVMKDYGFDQKDHFTTKRDLLGEIMDSLAVRGIKFSIYTHIFVGHDFHPNGSGYFMYDNKTGKITQDMINSGYVDAVNGNSKKWNDFVNAVYDEMSARYGEKVCAYWFDGTWVPQSWVDKNRMMQTIWKYNPTAAMVANGTPSHGLPYSSKEAASPESGEYSFQVDYPTVVQNDVTTWPSYTRHVALIAGGNWWASQWGNPRYNAEAVYRYTVLQAATNNNGGVGWSFGPFIDGSWEGTYPNTTFEMFKKANVYLSPVAESVKNTRASTSYITKEGSKINNLQSGFVATRSISGLYEYIHVLTPRSENALRIPFASDGRVFDAAILLAKNKEVGLEKNAGGYLITLPEDEKWDKLNTVFRLHLSEFRVSATSATTTFINPWGNSKISIKTEPGILVSYTQNNDTCSFSSQSGKKYIVALVKAPVYKHGKIESNPASIEVNFSEQLDSAQSITGFSVLVNAQNAEISSANYNANNDGLIFILKNGITKDDAVTISYSGGNIQSTEGLKLVDFTNKLIDNLLPGSAPRLLSATLNKAGTEISLVFNKKMKVWDMANSGLVVTDLGKNLAVDLSAVSLNSTDSTIAVLKPLSTLFLENRLQISYNGNTIFSTDDGKLASFANFTVENLASGMPPKAISAKIVNDGINVEITFDKPVLDVSASKSYFKLKLNDNLVPVTSILTSGSKVILYYSNPVRYGDVAILNFSGSTITSTDGGKQTVIENLSVQNTLPAISYRVIPARLEAENSILQSGTQKEGCSDTGGGQNVGYIDTGDWLDFAVDVKEAGDYTVDYRVASQSSTGKITFQVLGQTTSNLATTTVNSTGGWQSWTTASTTVKLDSGKQIIRTYFTAGGINLNWLNITKITTGLNDYNNQGFKIYPNPASEILNVEFSENNFTKIELFDMSGKLLLGRDIAHISKIQLPLSFKDGIYCLRIGNDQQVINQKLVVRN
jgi:hypothetical protein